jgi:hypothetical protein
VLSGVGHESKDVPGRRFDDAFDAERVAVHGDQR